jgi:hypothetical protein
MQDGASENKKHKKLGATKKTEAHAHIPPELLIHIDIPVDVLKSLYLLPSMMYRIESLMLASQLRNEVGYNPTDCCIPSSLVIYTNIYYTNIYEVFLAEYCWLPRFFWCCCRDIAKQ